MLSLLASRYLLAARSGGLLLVTSIRLDLLVVAVVLAPLGGVRDGTLELDQHHARVENRRQYAAQELLADDAQVGLPLHCSQTKQSNVQGYSSVKETNCDNK